jgi:tetratricopeptide (TPR) repeat protein
MHCLRTAVGRRAAGAVVATVVAALPGPAAAVSPDDRPPEPTETTTTCEGGRIWDADTQSCVDPDSAALDDDARFGAAREFAHAGRIDAARAALDAMAERHSDRVMTYRGFLARKAGDTAAAAALYGEALARNPSNLMARSYLGQGLAEAGDMAGARAQLTEIRARGGRATWAEFALRQAIATGRGPAW